MESLLPQKYLELQIHSLRTRLVYMAGSQGVVTRCRDHSASEDDKIVSSPNESRPLRRGITNKN